MDIWLAGNAGTLLRGDGTRFAAVDSGVTANLLALWGTGAYGFVAASNYNSRPRPAEVLVEGNRFRIIRRRESPADLIRGEN